MAAISDATVIVEASDTSGSMTQARACLRQKRPLFIMKACTQNTNVTWPERFLEKENVYEVENAGGIVKVLSARDQQSDYA
jgi:DNA processing protein